MIISFLHCKDTLFPSFHPVLFWKKFTKWGPDLSRESYSLSIRLEYIHNLFGILLSLEIDLFSFINLVNDLYQIGLVEFCTIDCKPILPYLFSWSNYSSFFPFGDSFTWLLCPFDILSSMKVSFLNCIFTFKNDFITIWIWFLFKHTHRHI